MTPRRPAPSPGGGDGGAGPADAEAARDSTGPSRLLPPVEMLWKSLVDSIDCFVMVVGPDLRIQYLNHTDVGFEDVGTMTGREMLDFVVPESREMVRRILLEAFATGRGAAYDVNSINREGVILSYSVRVSPVEQDGRTVSLVVTAIDSRQLHDTERALRAERQALRQFIRTQERERQLISYEIHDGLAQYLAAAMLQLEAFAHAVRSGGKGVGPEAIAAFDEGLRLVRAAATESRRLINGLRPPMLDELGIVESIESLVAEARRDIPTVEFTRPVKLGRVDANVETALFRIVQESLTNARKHAAARRAKVVLERRGASDIAAIVEDDGCGFDTAMVPETCFGLEGIRQRARLFGREAVVTSTPGRGTRIEVSLPTFPAMAPAAGSSQPSTSSRKPA